MEKLYVVVRADLQPGQQLAQSCHAVSAFALEHPGHHRTWQQGSQNLVVLQVPDETALAALLGRASELVGAAFHEPDLDGSLTAIALHAVARPLVSSLPLALRGASAVQRRSGVAFGLLGLAAEL